MKTATMFLLVLLVTATAQSAEKLTVYSGSVDLTKGQRVANAHGSRNSPYQGRFLYRMELRSPESLEAEKVEAGVAYEGADPETGVPGTPICWTRMIYPLGRMTVTIFNEDQGFRMGVQSSPIRASVSEARPYDGQCKAVPVRNILNVEVEAKDFYQAQMQFDVQMGVRLETHAMTIGGRGRIVEGKLQNFKLEDGKDSSVHWFAYDPSATEAERLENLVSGVSAISPERR